jgi:hypothetical protein
MEVFALVDLAPILRERASIKARLMTDEAAMYTKVGREFTSHGVVRHSAKEYAVGDTNTNTIESCFSLLKRGLVGTFHRVGEQHLQRYVNEFDFRWNRRTSRGYSDMERAIDALKGISGKRLTYRRIDA